uniref:Uncharacterized protein n=1 Tax=Rhizophora mucronata TaxID=61149 RepID=A0A2P2MM44_RHIMU
MSPPHFIFALPLLSLCLSLSGFLHCKPSLLSSYLKGLSLPSTRPTNHFTYHCLLAFKS